MKVLVVGSGGREHTLIWKLSQSPQVKEIYAAPGNGGISQIAKCIPIKADAITDLADFAVREKIGLTIVGPELPLALGIVDIFTQRGLKIFGPTKEAARLESSKVFAKYIMKKYGIPTANGEEFNNYEEALKYIDHKGMPIVVKADGLAAGKGVSVCFSKEEAVNALRKIMLERKFGSAGERVVIEDFLEGEELSVLGVTDGKEIKLFVPSQDHKRVFDGDKGPNTGGMGAYSPVPIVDKGIIDAVNIKILFPLIKGLKNEGVEYRGIIYAGLMITSEGPKVLEFNVRFGDPETQVVLPRMKTDLVEIILASINGTVGELTLEWSSNAYTCVVLASGGYPGSYKKGYPISGLEKVTQMEDVLVFHAGTKVSNGQFITDGGRVLGIVAGGKDLPSSIGRCYEAVSKIYFENMHYRKDIGARAISKLSN